MDDGTAGRLAGELWASLGGAAPALESLTLGRAGSRLLPSVFDVDALATATVAVATLAVAELGAARAGTGVPAVAVDPVDAAAAFRSEALLEPLGWELPPVWDPLAGAYRCADGYVRLHTNYAHHRAAALAALGLTDRPGLDRDEVAARVAVLPRERVERDVVAAGGCAAAMHSRRGWAGHVHGRVAVEAAPVVLQVEPGDGVRPAGPVAGTRPLSGVRVLDLTRVIAGPVATGTLAAWGADVLRVDPPGFAEVPVLLPNTTAGKRCAAIDLRSDEGRRTFARLVREADVVVHGLRPGALARLGFGPDDRRRLNPALVDVAVDAYGWAGPWAGRRGFDSLVQFSCGIAAATGTGGAPGVLPAQALDHGTGFLLAAAACRGLTEVLRGAGGATARGALVGTAELLARQPVPGDAGGSSAELLRSRRVPLTTAWGDVLAVPQPGTIGGTRGHRDVPAGPLGRDVPAFAG